MFHVRLPWPPSVNRYWRHFRGRTVIGPDGRAYRDAVSALVDGLRVDGDLVVDIVANPPDRRRRDLDNLLKAPLDALEHAGVYDDDNQVYDLRIRRGIVQKPGFLSIIIEEAK